MILFAYNISPKSRLEELTYNNIFFITSHTIILEEELEVLNQNQKLKRQPIKIHQQ